MKKSPLNRLKADSGPLEFLDMELTERCNFNCEHCYIRLSYDDPIALQKEMTCEQVCRLLREAVSLGCKGVRFTGGEPLVRKDFEDIYTYSHKLGLVISLSTNATCIREDIADLLSRLLPYSVSISIYGWDPISYDTFVRTRGAFRQFRDGIERLRKRNISFHMKYPAVKELVLNSWKIRRLARELGLSTPLPHTWDLTPHARNDSVSSVRIKARRLDPEEAARERLREPEVAIRDLLAVRYGIGGRRFSEKLLNCRAARKRLTIDAYGSLQVCLEMRHPDFVYNLSFISLSDVVINHVPKDRDVQIIRNEYLERCENCVLYPACPRCPAYSWLENGDLNIPVEYHCRVMHAEARLLGIFKEGEKGMGTGQ